MLEGDAARLLEIAEHVQGRVCVLDIIVGKLLALYLLCEGQGEGNRLHIRIESCALVRILAIAEALLEIELQEEFLGKAGLGTHIACNAAVVFCGVGISLCRKLQAGFLGSLAILAEFGEHAPVIGRIADYGNILPVLRSAAHHRRAAYIYILDSFLEGDALLCDGLTERIEVHANQVYGLDSVLFKGGHMPGDIAAGEDTAVHLGMQGLHTPVQNLRKSSNFADTDGLHTLALEEFLCAAGGNDLPPQIYQALHEGNQARLIAYAY